MGTRHPTGRRSLVRVLAGFVLVLLLAAGISVGLVPVPAGADPTPAPAPTAPQPTPTPTPTPNPPSTPNPTPDPTPNPSPQPQPTAPADTSSDDNPAWYDIPGQVRKAIKDFFAELVGDNISLVMGWLGTTVLSTPDLTADERVRTLWTTSLVTTNAVFVLFIVLAGFVVASRETLQTRHGLKQILPRLVVAGVASNMSLLLCGKLLWATNSLTAAIAGQGVDGKAAGYAIAENLSHAQYRNNFLLSLMILAVLVTVIVVVITFVMRVACMVLLIGFAPLALVCHALPQTEGLAYTWWRAMGACLGIQLAQAAIILGAIRIFFTPTGPTILGAPASKDGFMGVVICLCMLWIMIKIPGWMKQFVLGPIGQRQGRGLIGQLVHTYLMVKTLGMATGVLKGAKAARRAGTATRAAKAGTGTTAGPKAAARRPATAGPVRRAPAPAGSPVFSHAPAAHTPLGTPAGTAGVPPFSHTSPPAGSPAPTGPVPPAAFSSAPGTTTPSSQASSSGTPAPVPFSHTGSHRPSSPPGTPPPRVTFSAAPQAQTAPRRPSAPPTPTFSAAPRSSPAGSGASRPAPRRPTAARPAASATTAPGTTPPARVPGRSPTVPTTARPVPPARPSVPAPRAAVPPVSAEPPARTPRSGARPGPFPPPRRQRGAVPDRSSHASRPGGAVARSRTGQCGTER